MLKHPQGFEYNGVQTGERQRIGDTSCIDDTELARSIWISKITTNERHICLRRFKEKGCMSQDKSQLLFIRECCQVSDSSAAGVFMLIFSKN